MKNEVFRNQTRLEFIAKCFQGSDCPLPPELQYLTELLEKIANGEKETKFLEIKAKDTVWRERVYQQVAECPNIHPSHVSFLIESLTKIAGGEDADSVLGVKIKNGGRRSRASRLTIAQRQLLVAWVTTATMSKEEGGLGFNLDDAFYEAVEHFNFTYETIRHEYNNNREMREIDFEWFHLPKQIKSRPEAQFPDCLPE
jgi:hypothetical protein